MDRMGAQRDAFGRPYGFEACKKAPEIRNKREQERQVETWFCTFPETTKKRKNMSIELPELNSHANKTAIFEVSPWNAKNKNIMKTKNTKMSSRARKNDVFKQKHKPYISVNN